MKVEGDTTRFETFRVNEVRGNEVIYTIIVKNEEGRRIKKCTSLLL